MSVGEDSNGIVMESGRNRDEIPTESGRDPDGIGTESTDSRQNQGSSFSRFPNPDQHKHLTSDISWL